MPQGEESLAVRRFFAILKTDDDEAIEGAVYLLAPSDERITVRARLCAPTAGYDRNPPGLARCPHDRAALSVDAQGRRKRQRPGRLTRPLQIRLATPA